MKILRLEPLVLELDIAERVPFARLRALWARVRRREPGPAIVMTPHTYRILEPDRDHVRVCMAMEKDSASGQVLKPEALRQRLAEQLRALTHLCEPALPIGKLSDWQIDDALLAITAWLDGHSPEDMVTDQRLRKKKALLISALAKGYSGSTATQSPSPSSPGEHPPKPDESATSNP